MNVARRSAGGDPCAVLCCALLLVVMAAERDASWLKVVRRIPGPMPNLPFSAAVKADGLVYVAGTLVAEGDIRAQTTKVIENMSQALQKAGSSLANVASVHVYLTKADDFAAMNEVYRTFWPKDPPVRTTIVSDLVLPGALVEMSMVAVPNGGERVVDSSVRLDQVAQPVQLRHPIRRHAVSRRPGLAQRQGQLRRRRRHDDADQDGARQRRRRF